MVPVDIPHGTKVRVITHGTDDIIVQDLPPVGSIGWVYREDGLKVNAFEYIPVHFPLFQQSIRSKDRMDTLMLARELEVVEDN